MIITEETLRKYWAKEIKTQIGVELYRVGRMSYGAYFLEPGVPKGETEPFNEGTLWPEKILKNGVFTGNYEI